MMNEDKILKVKYRTWFKGVPPKPIKLEIPGWSGCDTTHDNGSKPQPWHCKPFTDGVSYGLELIYPFDNESKIYWKGNDLVFEGQFGDEAVWESPEQRNNTGGSPPMMAFAPGHYGMTSSLDIQPPEGYLFRLEPHPSYFVSEDDTLPLMVPANIHNWWSRIFFVVFKAPRKDQVHIFKSGMPYGQVLIIPEKSKIKMEEMTTVEAMNRANRENLLKTKTIATHSWEDHVGNNFDNKYSILKKEYNYKGKEGVDEKFTEAMRGCPYHKKK